MFEKKRVMCILHTQSVIYIYIYYHYYHIITYLYYPHELASGNTYNTE